VSLKVKKILPVLLVLVVLAGAPGVSQAGVFPDGPGSSQLSSMWRGMASLRVQIDDGAARQIGRATIGGAVAGALGTVAQAAAVAVGILAAPATALAYAVPIVGSTLGAFGRSLSDCFYDGRCRLTQTEY